MKAPLAWPLGRQVRKSLDIGRPTRTNIHYNEDTGILSLEGQCELATGDISKNKTLLVEVVTTHCQRSDNCLEGN